MEFYLVTIGSVVKLFQIDKCKEISLFFKNFLLLFWVLFLSEIVIFIWQHLFTFGQSRQLMTSNLN